MKLSRNFVVSGVLAVFLIGGSISMLPRFASGDHAAEAQIVSIKDAPEYQDSLLLKKAWALPVAKLYQTNIEFQANGSVCGPTSVANVSHSFNRVASAGDILKNTNVSTFLGYLPKGLTLDQLAAIARVKLDKKITVQRDLDIATFREQLRHVNDLSRRYIINFSRSPLFATGGGHHSPIAAYLEAEDLVLVLDVNKSYGPWLVKSQRLYDAMNTIDSDGNKKRGLLMIE